MTVTKDEGKGDVDEQAARGIAVGLRPSLGFRGHGRDRRADTSIQAEAGRRRGQHPHPGEMAACRVSWTANPRGGGIWLLVDGQGRPLRRLEDNKGDKKPHVWS